MFTEETMEILRGSGYTLILDEVTEVVRPLKIGPRNTQMLFNEGVLTLSQNDRVVWADETYKEPWGQELKRDIQQDYVYLEDGHLMYWVYPKNVFELFEETYVLTYLFGYSLQKSYFDVYGYKIEYIGVRQVDGQYEFCAQCDGTQVIPHLKDMIHIIDSGKVNQIGDNWTALSATKYKNDIKGKKPSLLPQLKKSLHNVIKYHFYKTGCTADKVMWTCFKGAEDILAGDGYSGGFLTFNSNAINEYGHMQWLAYCVNVFYSPEQKNYFLQRGVPVSDDHYALSTMVQWVWRSAIRNGKEIWLYVPSRRMRGIFTKWLNEVCQD